MAVLELKDGTGDGGQSFRWRFVMDLEGGYGYLGKSWGLRTVMNI